MMSTMRAGCSPARTPTDKAEFYRILLNGTGNPVVSDMLRSIVTRVSQARATSLSNPVRAQESLAEIRAFVAALVARDEDAAWDLCVRHIENSSRAALPMLQPLQEPPPRVRRRRAAP